MGSCTVLDRNNCINFLHISSKRRRFPSNETGFRIGAFTVARYTMRRIYVFFISNHWRYPHGIQQRKRRNNEVMLK